MTMDYSSPSDSELEAVENVQYVVGDLFSVAPGPASILGHACNCRGTWGAGVAAEFKRRFPGAFREYREHCLKYKNNPEELLGTCFLIHNTVELQKEGGDAKEYWIACLFTSIGSGTSVDSPVQIVHATRLAVTDLLRQLHTHRFIQALRPGDDYVPIINLPKINAGLFRVPWDKTEAVLKSIPYRFNIYTPE